MFKWLGRAIDRITNALDVISGALILVVMVLILLDSAGRNLLAEPLPGAVSWGTTALVALVFFAIPYGQKENQHVALDLFTNLLPERLSSILKGIGLLIVLIGLVLVTVGTVGLAIDSYSRGEVMLGIVSIPTWPARSFVALGMIMLCVEVLRTAILEFTSAARKQVVTEASAGHDPAGEKGL